MSQKIEIKIMLVLVSILLFLCASLSALADTPKAPCRLWGTVYVNGMALTAEDTAYTVSVKVDRAGEQVVIGSYTMGSDILRGDNYYVAISLGDSEMEGNIGEIAYMYVNDEPADNNPTLSEGWVRFDIYVPDSSLDIDNDQDGYTENEGDCDDTDAAVNPGATEVPYNIQ